MISLYCPRWVSFDLCSEINFNFLAIWYWSSSGVWQHACCQRRHSWIWRWACRHQRHKRQGEPLFRRFSDQKNMMNNCFHIDVILNYSIETLYSTPGQDEGGGCQDDPGNKGRRSDQVQQAARGSKTRWYTLHNAHTRKKTAPGVALANPSCCSTRQNAGSHPEEGETQDGWQIQ